MREFIELKPKSLPQTAAGCNWIIVVAGLDLRPRAALHNTAAHIEGAAHLLLLLYTQLLLFFARCLACKCSTNDKSHLLRLLNKINLVMSYDKTMISTAKQITCNWSCRNAFARTTTITHTHTQPALWHPATFFYDFFSRLLAFVASCLLAHSANHLPQILGLPAFLWCSEAFMKDGLHLAFWSNRWSRQRCLFAEVWW